MTAADVQRDLCGVIDDVPVVFTLNGAEYRGTRGGLVTAKRNVEGGMFEAPELSITTCLKKVNLSGKLVNRFPTNGAPEVGHRDRGKVLTVGGVAGKDYRIVRTHEDEFGAALQMDLESIHK